MRKPGAIEGSLTEGAAQAQVLDEVPAVVRGGQLAREALQPRVGVGTFANDRPTGRGWRVNRRGIRGVGHGNLL